MNTSKSYEQGAHVFKESVDWMLNAGVKYYTVYAFSCENWGRSEGEVSGLMILFESFLQDVLKGLSEEGENEKKKKMKGVRIGFIGRRDRLKESLVHMMEKVISYEVSDDKKGSL